MVIEQYLVSRKSLWAQATPQYASPRAKRLKPLLQDKIFQSERDARALSRVNFLIFN